MSDAKKRAIAIAQAKAKAGGRVNSARSRGGDPLGLGTLFGVPVTFVIVGAVVVGGLAWWRLRK